MKVLRIPTTLNDDLVDDHLTLRQPASFLTMYSPQMPGSFNFDTIAAPPKLDLNTSARGLHVFQPPQTPSVASSLTRSATLNAFSDFSQASRKRARYAYLDDGEETPGFYSAGTASPAPLVNSQYSLAGGLDTPTASTTAAFEKQAFDQCENDYRPNRNNQYSHPSDGYFPAFPAGPLSRERNGRGRASQPTTSGWSRAVIGVVGSVAGKMWQFCWSGAFRGFYAGGGKGYEIQQPTQSNGWHPMSEKEDVFNDEYEDETPIPGSFPGDDLIPDYMSRNHSTTPPRGSKKILREYSDGSLKGNWVIVDKTPQSRDGSPVRKLPRQQNQPVRRPVTASRPGRRTILAPSRPSLHSHNASPAFQSSRPRSSTSNRPSLTPTNLKPLTKPDSNNSPLSPDVQRHITRAKKREKQEDASLRRMTQQLDALIKQGREALGTKVEIEDDEDEEQSSHNEVVDEGYAEGEFEMEKRKPWEEHVYDDGGRTWG
jgi:hypothetical protein